MELYGLREDIGKRRNLALTRKDKRDGLLDDLLTWMAKTGAKMPSEQNPQYDPEESPTKNKPA